MAKPYFTRRRRISLKKAHIVLVDKCVLFFGRSDRIRRILLTQSARLDLKVSPLLPKNSLQDCFLDGKSLLEVRILSSFNTKEREGLRPSLSFGRSDRIRTCGIDGPKNLGVPVSARF